jgi:hypothetical protein
LHGVLYCSSLESDNIGPPHRIALDRERYGAQAYTAIDVGAPERDG